MEKKLNINGKLGQERKWKDPLQEKTNLVKPGAKPWHGGAQTSSTPYAPGLQTGLYSQPKPEKAEETPELSTEKKTAPYGMGRDGTKSPAYSFITGLQPGAWQSGSGVGSSSAGEKTERPEGYREPTLWDLTVGSFQQGYDTSALGRESFWDMLGDEDNRKEEYKEKLAGDEYKFEPEGWWEERLSSLSSWLGGEAYKVWKPETLALMGEAAGVAVVAGNLGPQALLPEEGVTAPAAAIMAYQAKSAVDDVEIQAGLAYDKMREKGVDEETARNIAMVIGGASGAISAIPMDSAIEFVKVLDRSGVSEKAIELFGETMKKAGVDISPIIETTLKTKAQEGVSKAGVEFGTWLEEMQTQAQEKAENAGIDRNEENPWISDDTASLFLGNQSMLDYLARWGDLKLTKGMKWEEKISAVKKAVEVAIERQKGIPSQ